MATYFIDLDSSFFKRKTLTPTKEAFNFVNTLHKKGNQIILLTQRLHDISKMRQSLKEVGLKYDDIIENVTEEKTIINDEGAIAINFRQGAQNKKGVTQKRIGKKVYDALAVIAWVNWKYMAKLQVADCDDYVQTILVANSLLENNGFDHADLVKKYREEPTRVDWLCRKLKYGPPQKYPGQLKKLLKSKNPLYTAKDGVTDGSAMKVCPIAAFYAHCSLEKFVFHCDQITQVTHGSVDTRLAAILVALRYRQIFLEEDRSVDALMKNFNAALLLLGFGRKGDYFSKKVSIAAQLTKEFHNPIKLLIRLSQEIGIAHLAWSTPITACFWSFRGNNDFHTWFKEASDKYSFQFQDNKNYIQMPNARIDSTTLKKERQKDLEEHLMRLDPENAVFHSKLKEKIDTDTFASIGFSLIAAEKGAPTIQNEIVLAINDFKDDIKDIVYHLVEKEKRKTRTYFIDFDGVFFQYGTLIPTKGALDFVRALNKMKDRIIFVTQRLYDVPHSAINLHRTTEVLRKLGVKYEKIIEGVSSPRILVSTKGAAINHKTNQPLLKNKMLLADISPSPHIIRKYSKVSLIKMRLITSLHKSSKFPAYAYHTIAGKTGLYLKDISPSLYSVAVRFKPSNILKALRPSR